MSYFMAYVVPDSVRPVDGDTVGSGSGWLNWSGWAAGQGDRYPYAAHVAEEGWLEPAEALTALEGELDVLGKQRVSEDVKGVTTQLLAVLKGRPEGCTGIIITDGTEGGDEEDEEEESD